MKKVTNQKMNKKCVQVCPYLEFPPRMKPPVEPVRLLEREAVMGSADIGPDADIEDIAGMTSQNIH